MFLLTLETELEIRMVEKMEDSLPDPPLLWADTGCLETLKRRAPTSSAFFNFVVTRMPFEMLGVKEGCVLKETKGRKCILILHSSPNRYLCLFQWWHRQISLCDALVHQMLLRVRQGCNRNQVEKV